MRDSRNLKRSSARAVALSLVAFAVSWAFSGCGGDCVVEPGTPRTLSVSPDGEAPYRTIAEAVGDARDGDIIELADGTYTGEGNSDIDFLGKAILLRSASGRAEACTIDCEGTEEAPHRAFWFHSGEQSTSVLEDLTIINGYVDSYGGGILCDNASSPTLRDLVMISCRAWKKGGGLYITARSKALVEFCSFISNRAGGGGGVSCVGGSPRIRRCRFEANEGGLGGGLEVYLPGWGEARVEECVFVGNRGSSGGAMFLQEVQTMVVDCSCSGNSGDFGGAVFCHDASPFLVRCTSFRDTTERDGAAMHCQVDCRPQVVSCTFTHGFAKDPGSLVHLVDECQPAFTRCILSFCTNGQAVDCHRAGTKPMLGCSNVYGSDLGDWTECIQDQFNIQGNISADPLFLDPLNGDLHLRPESPCGGDSSRCGEMGAFTVEPAL